MEMKRLAGRLVGQSDGDVGGGGKDWEELDWCTSCRLTDIQHAQKGTSFKRGQKKTCYKLVFGVCCSIVMLQ